MSQHPTIAIVGGGPGGLTLARILNLHGIAASVFEREPHPLARPQGGSLDMHPDTGQRALLLSGLKDAFDRVARYEDQGGKVYHPDGSLLLEDNNLDGNRPEIDRTQLRQLLLDALPPGVVRWDEKVERVEPRLDGRYSIISNAGFRESFDLVVGADGAWSRVRPLVSDAVPFYEGVMVADLGIDDADVRHPEIATLVGRGKMFAKGASRLLVGQRSSSAHLRVYAAIRVPEDALVLDLAQPDQTKRELLTHFDKFAPELRSLIAEGELIAVRPLYAMPIGHRWKNRPGVTLIGDAAHLMSPFGGEGANGAMADAADLATALAQGGNWRQAVADFETIMFSRAEEAARGAAEGLRGAVAEDAVDHVLEHFEAARDRVRSDAPRTSPVRTPKEMLETCLAAKTKNAHAQKTVNATYRFDLSGPRGGSWIVDFKEATAGVRQGEEQAQCTVAMSDGDFVAMLAGEFDPRTAFMNGKLKVKGDMGLAAKLGQVLAS